MKKQDITKEETAKEETAKEEVVIDEKNTEGCEGCAGCSGSCGCDDECEQVKVQLAEATTQMEDWKSKCMRALADYQNIERRSREEKNEVRLYASEIILGRLLPVVDTFGKVKAHIKDVGFDLAYKELSGVLEESGITKIDVVGKEFNPHEMECIEVVSGEENIVVEELLPGYRFFEKILRVAQVKVGKKV